MYIVLLNRRDLVSARWPDFKWRDGRSILTKPQAKKLRNRMTKDFPNETYTVYKPEEVK